MDSSMDVEVTALAVNVTIPEPLQWTAVRRGEAFLLTTLTVRLLADDHLAARAYGRPVAGGRGTYVSFPFPRATSSPLWSAMPLPAPPPAGRLPAACMDSELLHPSSSS